MKRREQRPEGSVKEAILKHMADKKPHTIKEMIEKLDIVSATLNSAMNDLSHLRKIKKTGKKGEWILGS